jgi:hypothetical protein
MQVEERSQGSVISSDSSECKPVDYYLNNFGTNDNPIVFQGELYRFKPGIQNNFISRWVQTSKHAFRYFKNFYTSQGNSKPLVAIPNAAILKITPFTDFNKESFMVGRNRRKNHDLEDRLFSNMFEIELQHDYESIYLYREIDA